jgi:proteasome alpha subunit
VYDRIAFAGAGKYSEFEHLRKAGIRHADLTGYMYSREDVSARTLSNAYSQSLGTAFSTDVKPLEVELLVVQVAAHEQSSEIYRILFDGSIIDEKSFAVIGGRAEAVQQYLKDHATTQPATLKDSLKRCLAALEQVAGQKIPTENLEVAVLDRTRVGRKFKRLSSLDISQLLA